ncbi:sec-independent protein translocase protein TatB [Alteromonadaceae bacterium Bs31]|nr:sec-independent protein translocase protein TatB [Alteromonadaceae bacterium Bs31]
MFDMGFLELMLVAVIGLLVIGPERLPSAIRTCAIWFSGIKRSITNARTEFERQIGADEIRREIHNEEIMASLRAAKSKQEEMRQQISSGNYTGVFTDDDADKDDEKEEQEHLLHDTEDTPNDTHKASPDLDSKTTPSENENTKNE